MKVLLQFKEYSKVRDIINIAYLHPTIQETFELQQSSYLLKVFDQEFNEYVDLENETELKDKDKIKILLRQEDITFSQDDIVSSLTFSSENVINSSDETPTSEISLRTRHWPLQIALPLDAFSSLLTEDLRANRVLSWDRSRELVGHLADYAYSFKPYPTKQERLEICHALINEFPYLKGSIGVGVDGWEIKLLNKLKKMRQLDMSLEVRIKRSQGKVEGSRVPRKVKPTCKRGEINWAPDHAPGESPVSVSLHKHNLRLEASKSKCHQDPKKISALMEITYSFRRELINGNVPMGRLIEEYPILFTLEQQFDEFQRLTAIPIRKVFFHEAEVLGPKMYRIFELKKKNAEESLLFDEFIQDHADMDLLQQKEAEVAFGLFVLPYLFKENLDSIIKIVPDGGDTPDTEFFAEPYPQIHLSGKVTNGCFTIFCEGHELSTSQGFVNTLCLLMSYYYTLNIEFPKKALNTMTFVKCALLKIVDGRIPPKVKSLMARANTFV